MFLESYYASCRRYTSPSDEPLTSLRFFDPIIFLPKSGCQWCSTHSCSLTNMVHCTVTLHCYSFSKYLLLSYPLESAYYGRRYNRDVFLPQAYLDLRMRHCFAALRIARWRHWRRGGRRNTALPYACTLRSPRGAGRGAVESMNAIK